MTMNFDETLSRLTDDELEKYLLPDSIYLVESVESAVRVLKGRGREFSNEETAYIDGIIEQKKQHIKDDNKGFWRSIRKKNIVKDENAPMLYSRFAIYLFNLSSG